MAPSSKIGGKFFRSSVHDCRIWWRSSRSLLAQLGQLPTLLKFEWHWRDVIFKDAWRSGSASALHFMCAVGRRFEPCRIQAFVTRGLAPLSTLFLIF
jgi:hypothetical protein